MKLRIGCGILLATVATAAPAFASWSLGTSLGMSIVTERESDTVVLLAAPGGAPVLFPALQPGLRLSSVDEGGGREFHLDAAATALLAGADASTFTVTGNVLQPFSPDATTSPYLTIGAGVVHVGFSGESSNQWIVGGGLGVRGRVPHGHGTLRAELRADYVNEANRGLPSLFVYGVKLGFDLWMR